MPIDGVDVEVVETVVARRVTPRVKVFSHIYHPQLIFPVAQSSRVCLESARRTRVAGLAHFPNRRGADESENDLARAN